jgi:hypothetical protein
MRVAVSPFNVADSRLRATRPAQPAENAVHPAVDPGQSCGLRGRRSLPGLARDPEKRVQQHWTTLPEASALTHCFVRVCWMYGVTVQDPVRFNAKAAVSVQCPLRCHPGEVGNPAADLPLSSPPARAGPDHLGG